MDTTSTNQSGSASGRTPMYSFIMYSTDQETPATFLRRAADEIDQLGDVDVMDIYFDQELRDPDMAWKVKVYWCAT